MSNISSATLAGSSATGFSGEDQLDQNAPLNYIARQHSERLRNVAQYLVSLAQSLDFRSQGALYVGMGQISSIANEAELVVNDTHIHNQFQLPHVQARGQDRSNSAANLPAALFLGSSNIETSDLWSEQDQPTQNGSFHREHGIHICSGAGSSPRPAEQCVLQHGSPWAAGGQLAHLLCDGLHHYFLHG